MVKKYKRKSLTYSYIMNDNNKDMEHVIGVICRQTTYDREKCIEKLEEFEGDFEKVLRDYHGIVENKKVESNLSNNQKIFKAIREKF
tara:strand:- start:1433 stop:1693 length:261 start_codon:yes stop_codon:yes gene_type:complete